MNSTPLLYRSASTVVEALGDDDAEVIEGRHHVLHRGAELPGPWVAKAECGGRTDLEPLFFPERGVPSSTAIAICASCSVRSECLEFALRTRQPFGIWGGTTAKERGRIERRRRRRVA